MEVNTRTLREASNRLNVSSKRIGHTLSEVETVRAQLRDLSNVDEFRWVLKKNEQSIENAYRVIEKMASVLEDIGEKYDRTENKVCDRELMTVKRLPFGTGYLPYYPISVFSIFRRIQRNRKNMMILNYINRLK